jgi:hypothetical protein
MRWAAGCVTTKSRSSCSPATSPWTGRPTSRSAGRKPPSATRPSPATGINHEVVICATMPTPQLCRVLTADASGCGQMWPGDAA